MSTTERSFEETLDALVEAEPQGIGRFAESLDPAWFTEALQTTQKASIRRRKLPAEQAMWLVLGMGLFADRSFEDVLDHLSLVVSGTRSLSPSAVPQTRYRLGAEPMEWLFSKVGATWAGAASPG